MAWAARLVLLAALWVILAEPVVGASPAPTTLPTSPTEGVVIDVASEGAFEVDAFTIRTRDEAGAEWTFVVGSLAPTSFPPFHLFEHTMTGEAILVTFEVEADGSLVATDLREAAGAWLDRPVPVDAPVGSTIELGVTLWDPISELSPRVNGLLNVRVAPATGDGPPAAATASSDWDGHYTARLIVPPGGVGELAIGIEIVVCGAGGDCERFNGLFSAAGVGPPPGIPLTQIASATILPPVDRVVAGRPFALEIELSSKADWAPGTFVFPGALGLDIREPRGPSIALAELTLDDPVLGTYRADVTLPQAGRFVVQVVAPDGGDFATAVASITAEAEIVPVAPTGGLDPLVVSGAILIAALMVGLGLYALRRAG